MEVFDIIFDRLPRGSWNARADYVGKDPFWGTYSQYRFREGNVSGVYSSTDYHVILYSLDVELPEPLKRKKPPPQEDSAKAA